MTPSASRAADWIAGRLSSTPIAWAVRASASAFSRSFFPRGVVQLPGEERPGDEEAGLAGAVADRAGVGQAELELAGHVLPPVIALAGAPTRRQVDELPAQAGHRRPLEAGGGGVLERQPVGAPGVVRALGHPRASPTASWARARSPSALADAPITSQAQGALAELAVTATARSGLSGAQKASAWARRFTSVQRCSVIAWMGMPGSRLWP